MWTWAYENDIHQRWQSNIELIHMTIYIAIPSSMKYSQNITQATSNCEVQSLSQQDFWSCPKFGGFFLSLCLILLWKYWKNVASPICSYFERLKRSHSCQLMYKVFRVGSSRYTMCFESLVSQFNFCLRSPKIFAKAESWWVSTNSTKSTATFLARVPTLWELRWFQDLVYF